MHPKAVTPLVWSAALGTDTYDNFSVWSLQRVREQKDVVALLKEDHKKVRSWVLSSR
jgi:hypothetical protein